MADSDNEIGAFLAGFVIGGLVGAAVALVSAPQSGEETRLQIRTRGIELRDRAVETAEETRKRAEEAAGQARTRAEQLAQDARAKADELQQRGKAVLDEQRERLEAAIEAGKKAAGKKPSEIEPGNSTSAASS
jgi:gas vesicle protein